MKCEEIMKFKNVPVKIAADFLNVSQEFIRTGIETGAVPFGICVTGPSGRRSFYINPKQLVDFAVFGIVTNK